MNTAELIGNLQQLNRWRRGEDEDIPMPAPRDIGRWIDEACEQLSELGRESDNLARQYAEAVEDRDRNAKLWADMRSERDRYAKLWADMRSERDRYHDALIARHGGEPVALLDELDAARAEVAELKAALEMVQRNCDAAQRAESAVRRENLLLQAIVDEPRDAEELRHARANLADLSRDKVRLDWLEEQDPCDTPLWVLISDAGDIRAGIDAAMKEASNG